MKLTRNVRRCLITVNPMGSNPNVTLYEENQYNLPPSPDNQRIIPQFPDPSHVYLLYAADG